MAEQWKTPQSDDNRRPTDETDPVRGVAEEGDEAFEDDEDVDDEEEEEDEEEGGTF
jgi:hypothetical protein